MDRTRVKTDEHQTQLDKNPERERGQPRNDITGRLGRLLFSHLPVQEREGGGS